MVTKAKTEYYKWPGEVKWTHLYEPDEFRGARNYIIDFFPESDKIIAEIKATGIQGAFKEEKDQDGNKTGRQYYRFKRPAEKLIGRDFVTFDPATIYDKSGKVLVSYSYEGKPVTSVAGKDITFERIGEPVILGHGTKVLIDVSVYSTGYGPGNRLNGLKIIDLVEYVKSSDNDIGNDAPQVDDGKVATTDDGAGETSAKSSSKKAPW